jgi:anti-sigma-K factor RskA
MRYIETVLRDEAKARRMVTFWTKKLAHLERERKEVIATLI